MSDEERDLTSEQEARVRRLLADARLGEPVPAEVTARLDRVLAALAAGESVDADASADVVDLGARRRRRAGLMLVAAAAVVAVGVGVGQVVVPAETDVSSGAQSDQGAVDRDGAAEEQPGDSALEDGGAAAPESLDEPEPEPDPVRRPGRPAAIGEQSFAADARRLQQQAAADLANNSSYTLAEERQILRGDFRCAGAPWGTGIFFAVRYDRSPAVLAFREPAGETQVVELLQCGSGDILRSTTLPYP